MKRLRCWGCRLWKKLGGYGLCDDCLHELRELEELDDPADWGCKPVLRPIAPRNRRKAVRA